MASLGGLLNKVSIGSNSNSNNNHNAQATASSSSPVGWDSFIRRGGAGAGHSNGQPPPVPQPPPPNPVYYNKYQHGPNARSASSSTAASHHSNSTDFHLTATSSSSTSIDSHRISGPNSPFATTFHAQPRAFPPPLEPRSYTILKEVGDGSFGTVWLADWHSPLQLPPGTAPPGPSSRPEYKGKKLVAVKRMKKAFEGGWEECLKLKELRSLQQIPMHDNIIPLYDAFLLPTTKELYFVFECMEGNLYQLTKSRRGRALASGLVASIFHQILAGLDHIHRHGYFHRDMKPENLLITTTGLADYPASSLYALPSTPPEKDVVVTVKLADFGLARETSSRPPYTEYVSTRWYRAPEVLLRSREYSNPVDMWALGTILVEVVTLKPLFPGDSEVDQVYKICEMLGDPSTDYGYDERRRPRGGGAWPRGVKMAKDVGFAFPAMNPKPFASLFDVSVVPIQLIDCISDLLRYEPKARLTTQQCLDHAYFREVAYRYAPYRPPNQSTASSDSQNSAQSAIPSPTSISPSFGVSPTPRVIPPSHSNGTPAYFKPSFGDGGLPAGGHIPPIVQHRSSDASVASGMSGYAMRVHSVADDGSGDSPMAFPENVSGHNSPVPPSDSHWSDAQQDPSWSGTPQAASFSRPAQMVRRPSLTSSIAPSIAASTYYDGSIFEGASTRAESVMSFPVDYGDEKSSPTVEHSPELNTPSVPPTFAPAQSAAPPTRQQSHAVQPSAASVKSGRWGFGKAFAGSSAAPSASTSSTLGGSSSLNPLKRTPSLAPSTYAASEFSQSSSTSNEDVKLSKKDAERAAKEAEKNKREAMQQAARDRARAVMKKKQQLMEAADPLHNFSNHTRSSNAVDKGKARASERASIAPANAKMPQIVEDTSRLQVSDASWRKARRRDVDDDVHSVSSNETGQSSQRRHPAYLGRPLSVSGQSMSSVATSASDPERSSRLDYDINVTRVPSLSSITSASSRPYPHFGFRHAPPPSTGHSSLDHSLITHMQGLATSGDAGWRSPRSERSESRGARGSSPHVEQRYSPYNIPPNGTTGGVGRGSIGQGQQGASQPQQQLPPISSFDPSPYRSQSSAASIASFHSTPSVLPSYYGRHHANAGSAAAVPPPPVPGPQPQRQYALDGGGGLPTGGSTFPYRSPPQT